MDKYRDKYRLEHFFYELIKLGIEMPGRPGFGSPISWLLEQMCTRHDHFLDRICNDFSQESNECRLNNAGLKMHWRVEKREKDGWRVFKCYISGDQAKDYPGFVTAAKSLIKHYGYDRR